MTTNLFRRFIDYLVCPVRLYVWAAIGAAAVSVVGGAVVSNQNRKAAQGLANKSNAVDIDKLITDARTTAAENYKNSMALEQQYNPQQAALRATANQSLGDLASGNTAGIKTRDSLLGSLGQPNSLLATSADSILQQLNLGGSLSPETQNLVARQALQTGGQAGLGGSFAGRGLVARDLGLTSLSLQQQRQQAALQAGQALSADSLNRFGAANAAATGDTQRFGLISNILDSRALPESGLSPGSIADATIGQNNAQNQRDANYQATLAGNRNAQLNSLLGFGSTALSAYAKSGGGGGGASGTSYGDMVAAMNKAY